METPQSVFERIRDLLARHGIPFDVLRHEPVYTSQKAAEVRGTPLSSGAKALVCRGDARFVMFVIPADRKLASGEARRAEGFRKLRFATREEIEKLTGLQPGSIPPFGSLFGLPTLCDRRLGENEVINFNAGDHRISVSMRYEDYFRAENPRLGSFAE
jgi:Ala-tRNA(Pro) deacylase